MVTGVELRMVNALAVDDGDAAGDVWSHDAMVRNMGSHDEDARILAIVNVSRRDHDVPADIVARLLACACDACRGEVAALSDALCHHVRHGGAVNAAPMVALLKSGNAYIRLAAADVLSELVTRGEDVGDEARRSVREDCLLARYPSGLIITGE